MCVSCELVSQNDLTVFFNQIAFSLNQIISGRIIKIETIYQRQNGFYVRDYVYVLGKFEYARCAHWAEINLQNGGKKMFARYAVARFWIKIYGRILFNIALWKSPPFCPYKHNSSINNDYSEKRTCGYGHIYVQ